ncbi:hypothetical protein [Weissella confusa]|uniref:hypothetical protein n=1 Tax=Weissella confusa TaxID=1583 RepID=UPI00177FC1F6|nr:hypothetical protein [Weissella confusa]
MLLIAAVLVLSIISFGIVAVCTAPPERRSRVALRIVDVLAALLLTHSPYGVWLTIVAI